MSLQLNNSRNCLHSQYMCVLATKQHNCLHSQYMCVLTTKQQSQLFTFTVYVCPYSSTTVATVYIHSICVSLQLNNSRNCLHSQYMCVLAAQQQSQLFTFTVYVCPYSSTTVATDYIHSICVSLQLNNSRNCLHSQYMCVLTTKQQSQLFTFTVCMCPYSSTTVATVSSSPLRDGTQSPT